jgi:hypothetical protein
MFVLKEIWQIKRSFFLIMLFNKDIQIKKIHCTTVWMLGLLLSDLTYTTCTKHFLNLDVLVWLFAFSCYTIHTSHFKSMLIYRNHKQLKTNTSHNDRTLSVTIHTGESGKQYWFSLILLIKQGLGRFFCQRDYGPLLDHNLKLKTYWNQLNIFIYS